MHCPYFPSGLESFAVLGKGRSLLELENYASKFDHCFLVNNFDEEIPLIGDLLKGKNNVHFVNRLNTAVMKKEHYQDLDIRNVQYSVSNVWCDRSLIKIAYRYRMLSLKTHKLPRMLLRHNKQFGPEYFKKVPNTGLLAIWYALELIRPRELWVLGMDFYQADYVVRRPWANPIEVQRGKMQKLGIPQATADAFRRHKAIKINMVTKYTDFPRAENVVLL